jgi:signal peptidase I
VTLQQQTVSSHAPAEPSTDDIQTAVQQPRLRKQRSFIRELIETILLIAGIYTFVNLATARFVVDGDSMLPNFETDQFIIVSRLSYIIGEPQRGDVVVFHYPENPDRDFIKRVVGLPGETLSIFGGRVYVNGRLLDEPYIDLPYRETFCTGVRYPDSCTWLLGPDEYFVLGDNRNHSKDSEDFGPVAREYIVGRAFVRYWPVADWGMITHWSFDNRNGAVLPTITPTFTPSPSPTMTPQPPPSGPQSPGFTPTPTYSYSPGMPDYR